MLDRGRATRRDEQREREEKRNLSSIQHRCSEKNKHAAASAAAPRRRSHTTTEAAQWAVCARWTRDTVPSLPFCFFLLGLNGRLLDHPSSSSPMGSRDPGPLPGLYLYFAPFCSSRRRYRDASPAVPLLLPLLLPSMLPWMLLLRLLLLMLQSAPPRSPHPAARIRLCNASYRSLSLPPLFALILQHRTGLDSNRRPFPGPTVWGKPTTTTIVIVVPLRAVCFAFLFIATSLGSWALGPRPQRRS